MTKPVASGQGGAGRKLAAATLAAVTVVVAVVALGMRLVRDDGPGDASPAGPATWCQGFPEFVADAGFGSNVFIDTSQQLHTGLVIREAAEDGRIYQHPSWDDAGNVGPYAIDRDGNIYVAPVPLVSMHSNRPEDQNRVFRVDGQTGEMVPYADLPWAATPSGANPYGVVGLAYDCDSHSLYASSVAGSDAGEERGRIHRIDLGTGESSTAYEGHDALGLAVFTGGSGKRLYYGSARRPAIYSVAVAADGGLQGAPRLELDLARLPGSSYDKIARIRFTPDGMMTAKGVEFSYSLKAASDPGANVYTLLYDSTTDAWEPQGVHTE